MSRGGFAVLAGDDLGFRPHARAQGDVTEFDLLVIGTHIEADAGELILGKVAVFSVAQGYVRRICDLLASILVLYALNSGDNKDGK
jgi:hypothetical protein